jgi:hypothetical protein
VHFRNLIECEVMDWILKQRTLSHEQCFCTGGVSLTSAA